MTTDSSLEPTTGLELLMDALNTRRSVSVLRALVALRLQPEYWFAIAETANRMLFDTAWTAASGDVIAAAIQIPVGEVRRTIAEIALSTPGANDALTMVQMPGRSVRGTGRLAAAYALARATDPAGSDVLLDTVATSRDADQRVAAAHGLTMLDPGLIAPRVPELVLACDIEPIAESRLFLGVALALAGRPDKLAEALVYFASPDADRLYFGDPNVLATDLEACGVIPEDVFAGLDRRFASGALPDAARDIVDVLPRAARTIEILAVANSHVESEPAAELAARLVAEEILDQLKDASGGSNAGILDFESATDSLSAMSSSDAAAFVQQLLAVSRQAQDLPTRIGNWLVCHFVPSLRRPYRPDVEALFSLSTDVQRDQAAWLISRAGMQQVVDALGPIVADSSDMERADRAAEMIESAARYASHRTGPVFGGGTPVGPPPPPVDLLTMHVAAAMAPGIGPDEFDIMAQPQMVPPSLGDDIPLPSPPDGITVDVPADFAVSAADNEPAAIPQMDGENGAPEAGVANAPGDPVIPRFVQAVIRREGIDHRAFLAGARNQVICWIGPEDRQEGDRHGTADRPVDDRNLPDEGISLDVVLKNEDGAELDRGKLHLFPGNDRSGDCTLEFDVPADERFLTLLVVFLYRGRYFEVVELEAAVVKRDEDESERDEITLKVQASQRGVTDLTDRSQFDSLIIQRDSSIICVGPGAGNYSFAHLDAAVAFLNERIFATSRSLVRARREGEIQTLDAGSEETRQLLVDLAQQGNLLYRTLQARDFKDPGQRIQLVNLDRESYVPIEFIYDRGNPSKNATIDAACLEGLARNLPACPRCKPADQLTLEERDSSPEVCPYGFWSLQKVIERHDEDLATPATAGALASDALSELLPIRSVLYALSDKVFPENRSELAATIEAVFAGPACNPADTWETWKAHIAQNPSLLVALPHHDVANGMDFLEIGASSQLELGRSLELYVRGAGQRPGPIMLLMGCETDMNAKLGYASFARAFSRHGAPVVIGTLSKIIGRHAVPVAQELVRELAAVQNDGQSLGEILLTIRRRLFVRGYIMALALVVYGDTDWRLATTTGGPHLPI